MLLTPLARIELAEQAHAEGRIIQGSWRKNVGGRELVCALAAFGPDINSASNCPADLMPRWLAELVPTLDDGIAKNDVPWFSGELIARARRWHVLDAGAWDRIRTGFMIAGIKQALASAEPVQPDPKPAYWQKVVDACNGVITALETGHGLSAAAAAEAEAEAAAEAARWAAAARSSAYKTLAETLFQIIDVELAIAESSASK